MLAFLQHADALLKDLQSDRAIFLGDHLVVVDALLADASDKTAYRVSIKMAAARAEYQKFESKTPAPGNDVARFRGPGQARDALITAFGGAGAVPPGCRLVRLA